MNRSHASCFASLSVVWLVAFSAAHGAAAGDVDIRKTTYVYKQAGDLALKADVHRPDDDAVRPVVVWFHGGALINGHREAISGRVRQMMLDAGYVLVSLDYRLAPEAKLPAIIEDLEDGMAWVHREGPKRFGADTRRMAVTGGSAGGYLTLTAGYRARPRPAVLVAFWGYGDLVGDWYSKPSPHQRHHRTQLTAEAAWQQVDGPVVADSRERKGDGGAFYQFCRQTGTWPEAVSGWDPHREAEKYVPYMPVRNVTPDYPPTFLIHGTADTDVPYEQSVMMARELEKHGVAHRLVTIPDAEHGLGGGDPELIDRAYRAAFDFVKQHIDRP